MILPGLQNSGKKWEETRCFCVFWAWNTCSKGWQLPSIAPRWMASTRTWRIVVAFACMPWIPWASWGVVYAQQMWTKRDGFTWPFENVQWVQTIPLPFLFAYNSAVEAAANLENRQVDLSDVDIQVAWMPCHPLVLEKQRTTGLSLRLKIEDTFSKTGASGPKMWLFFGQKYLKKSSQ